MTVLELINHLRQHDPDMRVIVEGYNGGLGDIAPPSLIEIVLNENQGDKYLGSHGHSYDGNADETALLIKEKRQ